MAKRDNRKTPKRKKHENGKNNKYNDVSRGKDWFKIKGKWFQIGASITAFNSGTKFNGVLEKVSKKYVGIILPENRPIAINKDRITEIY